MFAGLALILTVAYVFAGWLDAPDRKSLTLVGLLGWHSQRREFGFGRFVFGRSWKSLGDKYNLVRGGLLSHRPGRSCILAPDCNMVTWVEQVGAKASQIRRRRF